MKNRPFSRRQAIKGIAGLATMIGTSVRTTLATAALTSSKLVSGLKGLVIRKGDADYPLWRAGMSWYIYKPERYPDTIIQAHNEEDVVLTINHARENGQKVVVRSTGHNPARAVLRDGGILLDLSKLREIEIDAKSSTAWVQPGVRAEELLHETTRHGLAFPAAHTGIVGLGGYVLGGGIGWNMPEYNIACRSILAGEVITADGKKLIASKDSNADLHWAMRGSGTGFFGAVVRYKLQLYRVHQFIRLNRYVFKLDDMQKIIDAFKQIEKQADKRLEMFIKIGHFFPSDKPYAERELVFTVGFFAFGDSQEDAAELMSPVNASGLSAMAMVRGENIPLTYTDLYRPPETDYSSPSRTIVNNMWTNDLGSVLSTLAMKMQKDPPPSPRSFLLGGWSMNTTLEDPSSCVKTAGKDYFSWYMIADREEDNAANYKWMDESLEMTAKYSEGRYLNEIATNRYPHLVKECFTDEGWTRLAELRKKYDPANVFHNFPGLD